MDVGLSDPVFFVLASLIHQACLEQLKYLNLSDNGAVTDWGIFGLARVIDMRGLPMLESFNLRGMAADTVTVVGISAIAHATITGCPQLKKLNLSGQGAEIDVMRKVIKGMLHAAGLEKVNVVVC